MGRVVRAFSFCLALALLTGCTAKAVPNTPSAPTTDSTAVTTTVTSATTVAEPEPSQSATATEVQVTSASVTATRKTVVATYTTRSKPTTHTIPTSSTTRKLPGPSPNPFYPSVGTAPLEQGLNFNGKTYKYAYYGTSMKDKDAALIADFEKTYRVKLEVFCCATDSYWAGASAAMMSGKPYDIVRISGQAFPVPIRSNIMAPLDDYITTADLHDEKAPEKGGFSESFLKKMQFNHHIYGVGGVYTMDPMVLFYNKTRFGENDLLGIAVNNDKVRSDWTWERLLPILREVQDPDNGVWGLASYFLGYTPHVVSSYGTDIAKTSGGLWRQNLSDSQVYAAFETIKGYTCNHSGDAVVNPTLSVNVSGAEDFLNSGAAAAILPLSSYEEICEKAPQGVEVGVAPLPGFATAQAVLDWWGYGAGNGAEKEGILCALAFAKHEAKDAYRTRTDLPLWLRNAVASDVLQAPLGFYTSKGSLTDLTLAISQDMAKGYSVTVVLKTYEKLAQDIIDAAV